MLLVAVFVLANTVSADGSISGVYQASLRLAEQSYTNGLKELVGGQRPARRRRRVLRRNSRSRPRTKKLKDTGQALTMMHCTYHQKTPSVVQCNRCARPLCPACDHRIRGFPFCQDCIVTGVEMLRQQAPANPGGVVRRKSSPFVATLLSFVPGLGAAYNGQTSKAIVHFAIYASFFQMAVITQ